MKQREHIFWKVTNNTTDWLVHSQRKEKKKIGPKVEQENITTAYTHSYYQLFPPYGEEERKFRFLPRQALGEAGIGAWTPAADRCRRPASFHRSECGRRRQNWRCTQNAHLSLNTVPAKRNQVRSGLDGILLGLSASASR